VVAGHVTEELLRAVTVPGIAKVTLVYGRTDDGQQAAHQLVKRLSGSPVEVFRALLPGDLRQMVSETGPEGLVALVRQAEWVAGVKRPATPPASPGGPSPEPALPAITGGPTEPNVSAAAAAPHPDGEVVLELGDRKWRVRGLAHNTSYERLRVHVLVSRTTPDPRRASDRVGRKGAAEALGHLARVETSREAQEADRVGNENAIGCTRASPARSWNTAKLKSR
jgi:hypothetical protein